METLLINLSQKSECSKVRPQRSGDCYGTVSEPEVQKTSKQKILSGILDTSGQETSKKILNDYLKNFSLHILKK